ncbi:MAG: carboxypeptidase-like regulatory domain-containing protein [Cyclobacteriaceae bacterium]
MKHVLPLIISFCFSFSLLFAENPKERSEKKDENSKTFITGLVIDAATGEAVTGAKVELICLSNKLTAYSDFDGVFSFEALEEEDWSILVSFVSYKTTNIESVKISEKSQNLIISLQP